MIATPRPLVLRISVTDRCQLRCRYCMPIEGTPLRARDDILTYEEIALLTSCIQDQFGVSKVRITGGEPLVRPNIERLVRMLAELGIPDIAMTSNGWRLAETAPDLKLAGLGRVNISLDSLSPDTFKHLTGGGAVKAALAGISAAQTAGLSPLKLNTVVIRGVNDTELPDLVAFAIRENCEIRFIELMPIGPGSMLFPKGFMSSKAVRENLSRYFALKPGLTVCGSSARRYSVTAADGQIGTVGFISSCSQPFCDECRRLRVTTDGKLIGCLANGGGVSIRDPLRAGDLEAVAEAVRQVLAGKNTQREFEQEMTMASIGG